MGKIFAGFVLIFIDLSIKFGDISIELLPDFIGCFLVAMGAIEMLRFGRRFKKVKKISNLMAIITGVLFILDLTGLSVLAFPFPLSLILEIAIDVIMLYIAYQLIKALQEMEKEYGCELNTTRLMTSWEVLILTKLACLLLFFIPVLGYILKIAVIVAAIVFLYCFYHANTMFKNEELLK